MKASLKPTNRLSIVFLASAIFCVAGLIISSAVAIAPLSAAATEQTVHHPNSKIPQCMQRVSITSKPCGARIYVDGIQAGRTPISFPMPTGRYTLVLLAPGHQKYSQRILVPDAPLEIHADLVPKR